ncbi:MAG TPA: WG repeat-containing protein [Chitinophagaceae bacterium]|nr:WG repeat-containing protein [Chitinophagaceae bacterium]
MRNIIMTISLCIIAATLHAQIPFQDNNGKYGLKDNDDNIIFQGKYDHIDTFSTEGLAVVRSGLKYGFIDKTGKEIIPPEYSIASGFSEGLAAVAVFEGNEIIWRYIDATGREAIVCNRKGIFAYPFSGGFARILLKDENKWGLIDKAGKELVPPKYDEIGDFSEGMAAVKLNDKYGYIDTTGKEVIQCKYNYAGPFRLGGGLVMTSDNKMLHVDKTGKEHSGE